MNFLSGTLTSEGGKAAVKMANGAMLPLAKAPANGDGKPVVYGIRPEHMDLGGEGLGFDAEVVVVEPTGSETQLVARVGGQDIVAIFRERHELTPGQKIRLRPRAEVAHLFDKDTGARL